MNRLGRFIYAKYRAFAPVSCLASPNSDVVGGLRKWRWLWKMRKAGHLIEPSIRLRAGKDFSARIRFTECAQIDRGVIIWLADLEGTKGSLEFGNKVYIGPYSYLGSCHELSIGDNSMIGSHCYLITVNHRTDQPGIPYAEQGYRGGSIKIGKNVWLGSHVVVLPGVEIGDSAIIGAGAVVNRSVPAGETWGGVPARPLKSS